jgi:putative MATE family efflux protein
MNNFDKTSRLDNFVENPRRALWQLALPVMIGMSIQTMYMLVDMAFVGRLGESALAALAFNMPIVFLGLGVIFGLGSGVTAVIARHIGGKDKRLADRSAEHAVALGVGLSVAFSAVAYAWGKDLLSALGVTSELMPLAWDYFSILAGGYLFVVMSVFFRSILSGEGNTTTPMMIQGGGTLLNIALDPLFMFTFGLGVKGAALATVLSQACAAGVFVYLLFFKEHAYVTFELKDFRPSARILGDIFKVGAPASFSFLVMAVGGMVFNRILVGFSEEAVAAYQVGARIDHVFMLPVIAMSAGLVTLVGMFYGAKREDLVRGIVGYAMRTSLVISIVMGAIFFASAPWLVGIFSPSETIRAIGAGYLHVIVFSYPFVAVIMLAGRILQGMGQGSPVLVLSLLRVVLFSAPPAYVFVYRMGKPLEWVWAAIVGGVVMTAVIAFVWLRVELARSDDRFAESEAVPVAVR